MPVDLPNPPGPAVGPVDRPPALSGRRMVSPLLPVLLPIVVAAIVTGLLFAWLFPLAAPGGVAPIVRLADVTAEAGVAFLPETGAAGASEAPTTLGGGVVCFDYDGDGDTDIFLVNGAPWPWEEPMAKRVSRGGCVLLRNDGHGGFTNVSAAAGLNVELRGMTAAAGDYDSDGFPDLFITCVGPNHLFRNRGNGTFEDVTEGAGVGGEDNTWSTGAAWIDFDGDGRLDLVVCHYARWPREVDLQMAFTIAAMGRSYGAPTGFVGAFPSLFHNLGGGRFAPVPGSGGLRPIDSQTGLPAAKALAVAPVDANGDGRVDGLFSYHTSDAVLYLNQGDGAFRRWTAGRDDRREGVSAGLASTGSLPFTQTVGADERYRTLHAAMMAGERRRDETALRLDAKLGIALLDYDLDGRLDFFSGNGRAEPDVSRFEGGRDFQSVPELLWNRGNEWAPVPAAGAENTWARPATIRGVATADFDGDGDTDIVMTRHGGPPQLLRNDQRLGLPWLRIRLIATRSHPEAGGAKVEVHTPRRILVRTVAPAMGFMAQSEPVLTFGLGEDARVRKIVIHWPSGRRQEFRPDSINRTLVIREP